MTKAYASTSSPADVTDALQSIVHAVPFTFDSQARTELIALIVKDLKAIGTSKSRLSSKDASLALLAVKTLGKIPTGSEILASPETLSTLLGLSASFYKEGDVDASNEALRCIANTLLLHEAGRTAFVGKDVGGVVVCVHMLDKTSMADQIFILSRILFLCTLSPTSVITSLVEDKRTHIVDIISSKLDACMIGIHSGTKQSKEAMTDLLKFTFNLLMHYPKMTESEPSTPSDGQKKIIGDYWSSKLDGLLPPLLRVFHTLPPTFPSPLTSPLTHVIHSLITIPVSNPSLKPIWLSLRTSSPRSSPSHSRTPSPKSSKGKEKESSGSSSKDSSPPSSPSSKPSPIDRILSAGRRLSRSRSPSPQPPQSWDILQRTHDLLEISFAYYLPDSTDPDSPLVRERAKSSNDTSLDDILSPLVVLFTRLTSLHLPSTTTRARDLLIPPTLDRSPSSPLESRADLLGRCIRLMACVYHPRLKDAVGEMLFAACGSDAGTLSALVGYGNVAGFLFNKGIMSAPPPPTPSSSSASIPSDVNPITGMRNVPQQAGGGGTDDMTEEEKEREMEKLFVLFDRLERNGAIPKEQNPMRKVIEKGMSGGN